MTRASFDVFGKLDQAGRAIKGTVIIDRTTGTFTVRPYRRRRTYSAPLTDVATMVVQAIIRGEIAKQKREKAEARKAKKAMRRK